MTTELILAAIIALIILGSLAMIFTKKFRKTGLMTLGTIILILSVTGYLIFHPKHYNRNYLKHSTEWENLTIRQYADSLGFYIGAIPGATGITDPLFLLNFNSMTPESALKMGPLLRNKSIGDYDFSYADKLVNQGLEKNLRVRGHTLIWGKLSDNFKDPDLNKWLEAFPEEERSAKLKELMTNHITTVLNHFKGRIKVWDCVNEPTSYFRKGYPDDNVYQRYLGDNYIRDAFRIAHSVDPEVKLYLNEGLLDYTDKQADYFATLVKKLKDDNVPIHGVGLQSHIAANKDTSIIDLQNYIKEFTDLGLEVEITELDIRLRIFNGAEDPYEAQGRYYARLIEACMANPMCKGVTFWGLSDNRCWMDHSFIYTKPNEPYFFDADMNPKPAFYEVYETLKTATEKRLQ